MAKGRITVDEDLCKGCGLCTEVCPQGILVIAHDRFTTKGYHPAVLDDPGGKCTGCAICAQMCPDAAITVYRMVKPEKVSV